MNYYPNCPQPIRLHPVRGNKPTPEPAVTWCGCEPGCPDTVPDELRELEQQRLEQNALFEPADWQPALW